MTVPLFAMAPGSVTSHLDPTGTASASLFSASSLSRASSSAAGSLSANWASFIHFLNARTESAAQQVTYQQITRSSQSPSVQSPAATLGFFFSSSWLTNIDGMKDLWCSSAIRLLSTQIRMEGSVMLQYSLAAINVHVDRNGRVLWCSSTARLLSTQAEWMLKPLRLSLEPTCIGTRELMVWERWLITPAKSILQWCFKTTLHNNVVHYGAVLILHCYEVKCIQVYYKCEARH